MSYSLEIEGLVSHKHKIEAENASLRARVAEQEHQMELGYAELEKAKARVAELEAENAELRKRRDFGLLSARVAELEAENKELLYFQSQAEIKAAARVVELEAAAMDALCVLDGIADGDFKPDGTAISGAMVRLRALLAKGREG